MSRDLNREFSIEEIKVAKNYLKKRSLFLSTREMQIQKKKLGDFILS